jgi:hypothetical protein
MVRLEKKFKEKHHLGHHQAAHHLPAILNHQSVLQRDNPHRAEVRNEVERRT